MKPNSQNAKQQDAITRAQRILDAYCPNVAKAISKQPPVPPATPPDKLDDDADEVLYRIRLVEDGKCRAITREKREQLFEMRDVLRQTISDRRDAGTILAAANTNVNNLTAARGALSGRLRNPTLKVDDAVTFLKAAIEQFDKFVTTIVQTDATVGVNPLTSYIRAEKLQAALGDPGFWLQLRVLKAGGNNRIKTNLIIDIFTGGNRISHSGGTIVQYSLYNNQGRLVASDTFTEYINYIKANKVKQLPCSVVDDLGPNARPEDCLENVRK